MISRAKNNGGYTLLEISLTISIGILILLAATPTLGSFTSERRLRNVTNVILECASEARLTAKQQGKTIFLTLRKSEIETAKSKHKLLPKNMKLLSRGEVGEWTAADKKWTFFSSGIVEPLSLRLEQGVSWIEMDIDPLTGMVSEERFSF